MNLFTGSGVAVVTPFENGEVDYTRLANLIDWQIAEGTDAIIICGTTGESAALTYEEKKKLYKFAVDQTNGRVPVVASTGTNNTLQALDLSLAAKDAGADALLMVTPYYNKGNEQGIKAHFNYIADRVDLPIILYNVPSRTGVNLSPRLVADLAEHKNIQGLKAACGDISQIAETARLVPSDFMIYAGNDDQVLPIMSLGGVGVISAVANIIPKEMHECTQFYLEAKSKEAIKIQLEMLPLVAAIFSEVNPVPLKAAMAEMGLIEHELRLPLAPILDENKVNLVKEMKSYGLLQEAAH